MNTKNYQRESFATYKQQQKSDNCQFDTQNAISICIDWSESQPIDFEINVNHANHSSFSSQIPIEISF